MSDSVQVEKRQDATVVFLDRERAYNAFDLPMVAALANALTDLASDRDCRGVILTGRGRAFCAGGDLKWALEYPQGPSAAFHALAGRFHRAVAEIRNMPKPVAAAVNGPAAGGGFSLALACDFRVMEESAVLRQAYTSNGLSIDGGGTWTLSRLCGAARALEIAAFDRPVGAAQAVEWGLATRTCPDGGSLEAALSLLRGCPQIT